MEFAVAGVKNGIITPNEAREYLGMPQIDGADELVKDKKAGDDGISGSSPQDTGGGGGSQKRKMNIGTT
jgi:hypothetical protein